MDNLIFDNDWVSMTKGRKFVFFSVSRNKIVTRRDIKEVSEYLGDGLFLAKKKFSKKFVLFNARRNNMSPKFDCFDLKTKELCVVHSYRGGEKIYDMIDVLENTPMKLNANDIVKIEGADAFVLQYCDKKESRTSYKIYNPKNNHLSKNYAYVDKTALFGYVRVKENLGWKNDTWLYCFEYDNLKLDDYEKKLFRKMTLNENSDVVDEYSEKFSRLTVENLFYSMPELIYKHDVMEYLQKPENKQVTDECVKAVRKKMKDTYINVDLLNKINKAIATLENKPAVKTSENKIVVVKAHSRTKKQAEEPVENAKE